MMKSTYETKLHAVSQMFVEAETILNDIANDNCFEDEFLTSTHNLDDVSLHIHKAMRALRQAYKDHAGIQE